MRLRTSLLLAALVSGMGCAASTPVQTCLQGQSSACTCVNGRTGAQTCTAELVFGPCQCSAQPGSDAAVPTDAALPRTDGQPTTQPKGWRALPTAGEPAARFGPAGVWTGSEFLVWGGANAGPSYPRTGGRYQPATRNWRSISTVGAPEGRAYFAAVWTGKAMIVWGGQDAANNVWRDDGARYDPASDTWQPLPAAPGLLGREAHTAVWTGKEMVVWGGYNNKTKTWLGDGARYDPATNQWKLVSASGAPVTRNQHTAIWTGQEMIVWGGNNGAMVHRDGGLYDPKTDSWRPLAAPSSVAARRGHAAVWTGKEMLVWGGYGAVKSNQEAFFLADGASFDPTGGTWKALASSGLDPRMRPAAVWTGKELLVWGGASRTEGLYIFSGGSYTPAPEAWSPLPAIPADLTVMEPAAVWTGTEMLLWGGLQGGVGLSYVP
ncbi:MAG: hypothetical protein IT371_26570 [Deltaproteobacteria bacterium]|nr:hypothetical protein [Deltaproteobacteria bacterium]